MRQEKPENFSSICYVDGEIWLHKLYLCPAKLAYCKSQTNFLQLLEPLKSGTSLDRTMKIHMLRLRQACYENSEDEVFL